MSGQGCQPCNQNPCGNVTIVQGMSGSFYVDLFYQDTGEPFDLTSVSQISASFPGANGTPIIKTKTGSAISVIGANGAGKIQIAYAAVDSSLMQVNPNTQQNQDLQIVVTTSGIAQIDTLSLGGGPTTGVAYSVTLNGQTFSYTANAGDTSQTVFTQLQTLINASTLVTGTTASITTAISGTGNSATLIFTAIYPGLGFNDSVTNLTLTPSTANAGTRATFILQATLNIVPMSYAGS